MEIRDAGPADSALLLAWANDPATRAASALTDPIPPDVHREWLSARLADPGTTMFIGVLDGPLGVVRFQRKGDVAEISVNVAPERRGGGAGTSLIIAGCAEHVRRFPAVTIVAYIRPENIASQRAFERAGFDGGGSETVRGTHMLRFVFPPSSAPNI